MDSTMVNKFILLALITVPVFVLARKISSSAEPFLNNNTAHLPDSLHSARPDTIEKIIKTEEEWRKILSREEYHILRENGTEQPFNNEFYNHKAEGIYVCAACGNPLYSSETKYHSGTGWPSFYKPIRSNAVDTEIDTSFGMVRTEVHCNRCGGHLGHIFKDGPNPTGLRHCINSLALDFKPTGN